MPDDPSKPRPPTPRMQSQTERDADGLRAKRERDAAHSIPDAFGTEEVTGKYAGEDLAAARSKRPTDERIGRLENKHDKLSADIGELKASVGEVKGQMEVWPKLVDELRGAVDRSLKRDDVTFEAKVNVHQNRELSEIERAAQDHKARLESESQVRAVKLRLLETVGGKVIAGIATALSLLAAGVGLGHCAGLGGG